MNFELYGIVFGVVFFETLLFIIYAAVSGYMLREKIIKMGRMIPTVVLLNAPLLGAYLPPPHPQNQPYHPQQPIPYPSQNQYPPPSQTPYPPQQQNPYPPQNQTVPQIGFQNPPSDLPPPYSQVKQ